MLACNTPGYISPGMAFCILYPCAARGSHLAQSPINAAFSIPNRVNSITFRLPEAVCADSHLEVGIKRAQRETQAGIVTSKLLAAYNQFDEDFNSEPRDQRESPCSGPGIFAYWICALLERKISLLRGRPPSLRGKWFQYLNRHSLFLCGHLFHLGKVQVRLSRRVEALPRTIGCAHNRLTINMILEARP